MDNKGGNCCCHVCDLHAASLDNQILSCYHGDKASWPSCQGHPDICCADKDNVESGSGVSDIEKSKVHQGPEKVPGPGVKFLAVEVLPSSILVMCPPPPSQAVVVDRTVYISGQLGLDVASGQLVEGGVQAQAKQVTHRTVRTEASHSQRAIT